MAVVSGFFAKGEGTEAITFMLALDKCLELWSQNFFTEVFASLFPFSWYFSTHIFGGCLCTFLL